MSIKLRFFIFIAGIVFFILFVSAIEQYFEKKKEQYRKVTLKSIDYHNRLSSCLFTIFGTKKTHQIIQTSNIVVNNFCMESKIVDYLIKYFGMTLNNESLDALFNLRDLMEELERITPQKKWFLKTMISEIPSVTMKYTSPAGRSSYEKTLFFTYEFLNDLLAKIERKNRILNSRKERRPLTKELREFILSRDDYTCQMCGNTIYDEPNLLLEIDHIIPVAAGGTSDPENLQTLCWKCNRSKSSKL